ncbi:hypothetical protein QLQ12_08865 [Actinoplanes sp. NEAU-A12]|uniref:Uncharacterized protein n=1 Tax=Actinoplanes sandaracinus TaxID=3045177 RepID=A0ABT6WG53_9ACTN|nr:hypothetical protein [Actinoplanes sandaracinus]MDI6098710.1 hypothetical protein [Actinoplanes sandaracinus]
MAEDLIADHAEQCRDVVLLQQAQDLGRPGRVWANPAGASLVFGDEGGAPV